MVVVPNCSQICVSACAGPAATNVVTEPTASRAAAVMARMTRLMTAPGWWGNPGGGAMGALPRNLQQIDSHEKCCGKVSSICRGDDRAGPPAGPIARPRPPAAHPNGADDVRDMQAGQFALDIIRRQNECAGIL